MQKTTAAVSLLYSGHVQKTASQLSSAATMTTLDDLVLELPVSASGITDAHHRIQLVRWALGIRLRSTGLAQISKPSTHRR